MYTYLIIDKNDSEIYWQTKGNSFPKAIKKSLKKDIDSFYCDPSEYLDENELKEFKKTLKLTKYLFECCVLWHLEWFRNFGYVIYRFDHKTKETRQLEQQELS